MKDDDSGFLVFIYAQSLQAQPKAAPDIGR
jgi:hypothetical protein